MFLEGRKRIKKSSMTVSSLRNHQQCYKLLTIKGKTLSNRNPKEKTVRFKLIYMMEFGNRRKKSVLRKHVFQTE